MPKAIYDHVRVNAQEVLEGFFELVKTPIEGPGKTNYGDVDFLVAGLRNEEGREEKDGEEKVKGEDGLLMARIQKALGAVKRDKGGNTTSFAVAWPKHSNSSSKVKEDGEAGADEPPKFAQIDLEILPSAARLLWAYFHNAHGDLWNIIGSGIRPLGLTVNDTGLQLRIGEIELIDRKKSLVFLSDDPRTILRFLGLDENVYWSEFAGRWELYTYVAKGRFFWVDLQADEKDVEIEDKGKEGSGEMDAGDEDRTVEGETSITENPTATATAIAKTKKELKHNDRKRMAQRPVFAGWIEEFLPWARQQCLLGTNTTTAKYPTTSPSRSAMTALAFSTFGSHVQEEYNSRLLAWQKERQDDDVWRRVIKGGVPEDIHDELRGAAIRALKSIVFSEERYEDRRDGKIVDPKDERNQPGKGPEGIEIQKPLRNEDGTFDVAAVEVFVRDNWKRLGEIELAAMKVKNATKMREKNAKPQNLRE